MKNTIKTIALSVSILGAAMTTAQAADVRLHTIGGFFGPATLSSLSQHASNGTALNLAVNTNMVNASVNTAGGFNYLDNVGNTIAVTTSAVGAANTGNISLEQGSMNAIHSGTFAGSLAATEDISHTSASFWGGYHASDFDSSLSAAVNSSYYNQFSETLSNYSAANIAYNSGAVNASVNTVGLSNHIDGISTSALGAVNTGSITVTVH